MRAGPSGSRVQENGEFARRQCDRRALAEDHQRLRRQYAGAERVTDGGRHGAGGRLETTYRQHLDRLSARDRVPPGIVRSC